MRSATRLDDASTCQCLVANQFGSNVEHVRHLSSRTLYALAATSTPEQVRAVLTLLNDADWSKWSDNEIARRCGVSPTTVGAVRSSLSTLDSMHRTFILIWGISPDSQNIRAQRHCVKSHCRKPTVSRAPSNATILVIKSQASPARLFTQKPPSRGQKQRFAIIANLLYRTVTPFLPRARPSQRTGGDCGGCGSKDWGKTRRG